MVFILSGCANSNSDENERAHRAADQLEILNCKAVLEVEVGSEDIQIENLILKIKSEFEKNEIKPSFDDYSKCLDQQYSIRCDNKLCNIRKKL